MASGLSLLPSALNVNAERSGQARVNGGSNYDYLKVAVLDSLVRVSTRVVRNRFVYNQVIELKPYDPTYAKKNTPAS